MKITLLGAYWGLPYLNYNVKIGTYGNVYCNTEYGRFHMVCDNLPLHEAFESFLLKHGEKKEHDWIVDLAEADLAEIVGSFATLVVKIAMSEVLDNVFKTIFVGNGQCEKCNAIGPLISFKEMNEKSVILNCKTTGILKVNLKQCVGSDGFLSVETNDDDYMSVIFVNPPDDFKNLLYDCKRDHFIVCECFSKDFVTKLLNWICNKNLKWLTL